MKYQDQGLGLLSPPSGQDRRGAGGLRFGIIVMGKVCFTSDTHFGHARVISLCRRPFAKVREMDEALIRAWNESVQPDDIVWHGGDFAFGEDSARIDEIFARLAGTKHLVLGNHDEENDAVLTLPWASVSNMATLGVDDGLVTICHYPMRTWPKAHKGAIHLFGHKHGRMPGTPRSLDMGVDVWKFRPVSFPEIAKRLRTLPPDTSLDAELED